VRPNERLSRLAEADAEAAAPDFTDAAPEPDAERACRCVDPLLTDF
jgi:hypothetical protein